MSSNRQERAYQNSHPWINFSFDTRLLDYRTWILLGEAKSKWEHILGAPLLPETIKIMSNVYLAKGALATTAIEGNTLTQEQVEKRIRGELILPPSKEYLGQEIDNIVAAYNEIGNNLLNHQGNEKLSIDLINHYNALVLKDLPLEEGVTPGIIRNYSVSVATYRGAPPEDCDFLMRKYVDWLNNKFVIPGNNKIIMSIIKAILAHIYFVWIHPYGDGNGRTARLLEFQILLAAGAPPVAAHLLSNHYNATRTEYYRHLDRTSKSQEYIADFVLYALQGFVDGLQEEINTIQAQQIKVHWINHIYNTFKGKNSKTEERQRDLILEISEYKPFGITFTEIRHTSPKIAEMYASVSDMTIRRDIAELVGIKLLVAEKDQYKCNISLLNIYRLQMKE